MEEVSTDKKLWSEEQERILNSEMERFVRWLIAERSVSLRMAVYHARMIKRLIRKVGTMLPTKADCQRYKEDLLLAGRKPGYVIQVVRAIRHYGRFIGGKLQIRYPQDVLLCFRNYSHNTHDNNDNYRTNTWTW